MVYKSGEFDVLREPVSNIKSQCFWCYSHKSNYNLYHTEHRNSRDDGSCHQSRRSTFITGSAIPTVVQLTSGENTITAIDVIVVSSTKITCNIPIPTGSATGFWNVVITNPDSQIGTLPNGFTISPAAPKPITVIQPGGTVFIGEQGLNVVAATGETTQVAWFASGTRPDTDAPTQILSIGDPTRSTILTPLHSLVHSIRPKLMTGNWYRWNGGSPAGAVAFVVQDPWINIQLYEPSRPISDGDTRYLGTLLNFRIDSNLFPIAQRQGVNPVTDSFMSISVQNPNAVIYNELFMSPTVTPNIKSLLNLPYQQQTFYWTFPMSDFTHYWFTNAKDSRGFYQYPTGTYSTWATSTANGMNQAIQLLEKPFPFRNRSYLYPKR